MNNERNIETVIITSNYAETGSNHTQSENINTQLKRLCTLIHPGAR